MGAACNHCNMWHRFTHRDIKPFITDLDSAHMLKACYGLEETTRR